MKAKFIALLCLVVGQAVLAAPAMPQQDGGPAVIGGMESTAKSKARLAERRKANAKIKLVDINSANEKQLMKLPGIGETEAKRIIANRPYASKVWLVTNGVIGEGPYISIKSLIEAKQPHKTADENAAMYEKLKKEKADKAKP